MWVSTKTTSAASVTAKNYEPGLAHLEKALAVYSRAYPDDHTRIGQTLMMIGNIHNAQQQFPAAEAPMRRALAIFQKNLTPEHQLIALTHGALGQCLTNLGQYQEAKTHLLTSATILQNNPNAKNQYRATLTTLVDLYTTWPRPDEAAKYQRLLNGDADESGEQWGLVQFRSSLSGPFWR